MHREGEGIKSQKGIHASRNLISRPRHTSPLVISLDAIDQVVAGDVGLGDSILDGGANRADPIACLSAEKRLARSITSYKYLQEG